MNLRLFDSGSMRAVRKTLDDVRSWYGLIGDEAADARAFGRTVEEIDKRESVEDALEERPDLARPPEANGRCC